MTTAGWIFFGVSWTVLIALAVYCLNKVLKNP